MATGYAPVDICNRALPKLSVPRITSLTDGTAQANDCNVIFAMVSEFVQAQGPWPCNKLRVTLNQLSTPPVFGFAYQYQLPPDCSKVLRINEDQLGSIDYQIENGVILCDEPAVQILYISTIQDTSQFDVYLREAIIWALAAELAYKYTGQLQGAQAWDLLAEKKIEKLLNLANEQGSDDYLPSNAFTDIRYIGGDDPGDGEGGGQGPFASTVPVPDTN